MFLMIDGGERLELSTQSCSRKYACVDQVVSLMWGGFLRTFVHVLCISLSRYVYILTKI